MEIKLDQPEKMNLVGYFLRDLLTTNLTSETGQKMARHLRGTILFNASGMLVAITFHGDYIELQAGSPKQTNSKIAGDLNALLDVALGANFLKYLLIREIKISGNVFQLLKLLKLIRRVI
jgi:hypothetical protein